MTLRKFRWYNSPTSKFPGRRGFFTASGSTVFKLDTYYTVSTYDPKTGYMTDYGAQGLEVAPDRVVFILDLAMVLLEFVLVGDTWSWVEHPDRSVMFQEELKPLIELADPNHPEDIPEVELCFDDESDSATIEVDEEGVAHRLEEYDGDDDEPEDAPADWIDDAR